LNLATREDRPASTPGLVVPGPLPRATLTAGQIGDSQPTQLERFVPLLIAVAFTFAAVELVTFLAFPFPQTAANVVALGSYGLWLTAGRRRLRQGDPAPFVLRMAVGVLAVVVLDSVLQPTVVAVLIVATIIPTVFVVPYLGDGTLRRFIGLTWLAGIFVTVMGEVMPVTAPLPPAVSSALRVASMGIALGLLLFLLWQFSSRLKSTARELGSLAALSSELAQTMDPLRIGDLMADHLAAATGAQECGICYWDRAGDRVLTYGYHPRERRAAVAESYRLADYPATRGLLEAGRELVVRVDDPAADPAEVAYLHSIGMRSMAMLPLVAQGAVIGIVELYAADGRQFSDRELALARALGGEAAMALDNARLYEELRHQAFHDGLTGLANRGLLMDRLEHALVRSARTGSLLGVLFLDLDDFKTVNDRFGHAIGDLLLRTVAERLVAVLQPGDTAARLGGDEFAVLLEDISKPRDAELVATRLIDAVRAPVRLAGVDALVGASVGVAVSVAGTERADDLLRNADLAMYRAKSAGKGRHELFAAHMRDGIAERAELAAIIQHAVDRAELRLLYQPIVELESGSILGVEALLRWRPAGRRTLLPGEFISLAEESGQIVPIGRWALGEACRQARRWQDRLGQREFRMNVNLSARQFRDPGLVQDVLQAIREAGIDPDSLTLEITESVLMQDTTSTIEKLAQLRANGIRLAIDDFGTGYSSLSYLDRFPIDGLKIDRTFIDGFGAGQDGPVLVRAIIELGNALGLEVVAEGIERTEQLGPLQALGCRLGQGYLFAQPLDADALGALLAGPALHRDEDLIALPRRPGPDSADADEDAIAGDTQASPASRTRAARRRAG
jgi:diguanylate cyclase (GGDEF)-like protein